MEIMYRRIHPSFPWLTPKAVQYLHNRLKPNHVGLEWGSGRSTIWLAQRIKNLVSIEHDRYWYTRIKGLLLQKNLQNVEYHLYVGKTENGSTDYVEIDKVYSSAIFDLVLIDGIQRDYCAEKALKLVKPGGMIVLDNANWYLPSGSKSPHSRSSIDGPLNTKWQEFSGYVLSWECIWTSSGVTDTAIWIRPAIQNE